MVHHTIASSLLLSATILAGSANADILIVNSGESIQTAINFATDGDEVLVRPGTYLEHIDFVGKSVLVRAESGPAVTVIDGSGFDHTVSLLSGETRSAELAGFTIRGGGDGPDPYALAEGAGIYITDSSPTISDCIIEGNHGSRGGGTLVGSSPQASPLFERCTFHDNSSTGYGGAVAVIYATPEFRSCRFLQNTSVQLGGAAYILQARPLMISCEFIGNSTQIYDGGAIACDFDVNFYPPPQAINCTFVNNTANTSNQVGRGGAISAHHYIVTNCIMWGNAPDQLFAETPGGLEVTYSNVEGNYPGQGNIAADPMFLDPVGSDGVVGTGDEDLRLEAGSPCIDAGNNAAVPAEIVLDLGGNARFVDEPDVPDIGSGDPPIVDMGAYEAPADLGPGTPPVPPVCAADYNRDGTVDVFDLLAFLNVWFAGCP